jgi:hypothetical protein
MKTQSISGLTSLTSWQMKGCPEALWGCWSPRLRLPVLVAFHKLTHRVPPSSWLRTSSIDMCGAFFTILSTTSMLRRSVSLLCSTRSSDCHPSQSLRGQVHWVGPSVLSQMDPWLIIFVHGLGGSQDIFFYNLKRNSSIYNQGMTSLS